MMLSVESSVVLWASLSLCYSPHKRLSLNVTTIMLKGLRKMLKD